jgi:hypothetical protein
VPLRPTTPDGLFQTLTFYAGASQAEANILAQPALWLIWQTDDDTPLDPSPPPPTGY